MKMNKLLLYFLAQLILILLLFVKDKNNGEKELFKRQNWRVSEIAIIIIALNLFRIFQYATVRFKVLNFEIIRSSYPLLCFYFFGLNFFLFILLLLIMKIRKVNFRIFGTIISKKNMFIGILGGIGSVMIYVILASIAKPNIELFREIRYLQNKLEWVSYIVTLVIFGPIIEELLFRGMLYSPYRKKYGSSKAIFLVAILFTFVHLEFTLYSILVGVLWGYLYEKTESIITPIVAHSINNLLSLITFYILQI